MFLGSGIRIADTVLIEAVKYGGARAGESQSTAEVGQPNTPGSFAFGPWTQWEKLIVSLPRFCLIYDWKTSLNQHLLKDCARLHTSGNQGLGSAGLTVWAPWGGRLLLGEVTLFPPHWDLRLPLGHLKVFMLLGQNSFLVRLLSIFLTLVVISSATANIQMSVRSSLSRATASVLAMATAVTATALWRRHGCAPWKAKITVAAQVALEDSRTFGGSGDL